LSSALRTIGGIESPTAADVSVPYAVVVGTGGTAPWATTS
jgi:hypothetical protein